MNSQVKNAATAHCIRTRYGEIAVPEDSEDLIVQFLRHYGEWAFIEAEFIASFLPKRARVLDVGAFLGTFSLGLAQTADLEFVAMVEANPAAAVLLTENAASSLNCHHEVISALVVDPQADDIIEGWAAPGNMGSASFIDRPPDAVRIQPSDERIQLQDLLQRLSPLHLVKLDVEGMEKQLLSSCPSFLRDSATLFWLECNESPASIELCRLLLDTGRPLTYFAWPSHNAGNYLGTTQKLFHFAHEAGLLVGAAPKPLTPEQKKSDCIVRSIFTLEDLREAMWSTPRWAPPEWDQLARSQLAAVASNIMLGKRRETFLLAAPPVADPSPALSLQQLQRVNAQKEVQIVRLKRMLAERAQQEYAVLRKFSAQFLEAEQSITKAQEQAAALDRTINRVNQENEELQARVRQAEIQACEHQAELQAREQQHQTELQARVRQAEIQACEHQAELQAREQQHQAELKAREQQHQAELKAREQQHQAELEARKHQAASQTAAVQTQLDEMRGCVTWRGAVRLSQLAGYVPFLKPTVKFLLRKKRQWVRS